MKWKIKIQKRWNYINIISSSLLSSSSLVYYEQHALLKENIHYRKIIVNNNKNKVKKQLLLNKIIDNKINTQTNKYIKIINLNSFYFISFNNFKNVSINSRR